jgi:hypothetical protein
MFIYKKGTTTDDEIIGHLLFLLNNEFIETYIPIKDFCHIDKNTIDRVMATRVLEKMIKYDVATPSPGTGCDEFDVVIRPNGENIVSTDQWIRFITLKDKIMEEREKLNNLQPIINYGNLITGDSNSNVTQRLESSEIPFHNTDQKYPHTNAIITGTVKKSILEKIKDFTNHGVVAGIISAGLIALSTTYYSEIWAWLKSVYEKL